MRLAARGRIILVRHRWIYWLTLACLAVGLGTVVNAHLSSLDAARDTWVDVHTVHVARHDHRPDEPLVLDEIELPAVAVPPSALTRPPDGLVARRHIGVGEIVVERDVMRVEGPASRAEPGTVVVGITDVASASIGLKVTVVSDGLVLAPNGVVVDVDENLVFVAVDDDVGAMVAHAARQGTASLLFAP